MGLCLGSASVSASIDWAAYGDWTLAILMAAAGLGFIIFVHELGHFAVAKWCGVKCDKFMIGFDIGGWKLSRKWGETVYGIGILPLGGYVKMMGQDDDPRITTEQLQQSKATDDSIATKEITGPGGEKYLVDARSYLAKTVPQRMAIISAGVIMNIIFAFVFAVIAFMIGVPSMTCEVGATVAGSPAWENGLRPGDRIAKIGDIEDPWFNELREEVTLAQKGQPIDVIVERADGQRIDMKLTPDRSGQLPAIGITNSSTLALAEKKQFVPNSPADKVGDQLTAGATIVAVNGTPVDSYAEWKAMLVENNSKPLTLTLESPGENGKTSEVTLPPNRRESIGLAVAAGAIVGVEKESPAAKAGLNVGDLLIAVDGKSLEAVEGRSAEMNPLDLADYARERAIGGATIELTVARDGDRDQSETISVTPRRVTWEELNLSLDDPTSVPALGIAIPLVTRVVAVERGSPADKAGIKVGDSLQSVSFKAPEGEQASVPAQDVNFTDHPRGWAAASEAMQDLPSGASIDLVLVRSGSETPIEVSATPRTDDNAFVAERGIILAPLMKEKVGNTFGEQLSMGAYETKRALTSVYRFLLRLTGGDISPKLLGGPLTIAQGAAATAMRGWGDFLLFLTLISANLAVVNFLPIPVLDGGHMVFLLWEGLTGRPANDKVVTGMSLLGLALILTLMIWVFGLDIGRLFGWV